MSDFSSHRDEFSDFGDVAVTAEGKFDRDEVVALYNCVGWTSYTADADALMRGLAASTVLTARRSGRLVGLARLIGDGETIAYLQDLIVDPDHQRQGIGRALLADAMQRFGHCRQFFLTTGAADPARAFYDSMGLVTHDAQGLVAYGAAEVTARLEA